jgi:hypothetical protein
MVDYVLKALTGKYKMNGEKVSLEIKRGETSWAYFPLAYNILLTISVGIISCSENDSRVKFLAILLISCLLFYLCFFGPSFRNRIVGLFSKSKEFIEKSDS